MSEIHIFQGNQIGGCSTLITTDVNGVTHRILIDYGVSLPGSDTKEDFIYPWEEEPVDAVFFTHYHGDHTGRLPEIPRDVPVYIGDTARKVMINIQEKLSKTRKADAAKHAEELAILKDDDRIRTFKYNKRYRCYEHVTNIPGFKIEPYSVDHSAYDAYMFLIEADDPNYDSGKKVILHTGDFRGHGRRGGAMLDVIRFFVHKGGRKVNALITEGTMLSRMEESVLTETQMMYKALKILKKNRYAFLICSSTNLDSLASFYQAAQMAAKPYYRTLYVYNDYLEAQLKTFSDTAGGFTDVYKFKHVRELDLNKPLYSAHWEEAKTQKELMERTGFLAIIKPEDWCEKYIDSFIEDYRAGRINQMPVIIYSMWDGYVQEKRKAPNGELIDNKAKNQKWIDFLKKQEEKGVEVHHLHTSGHASAQMLADVIKAVAPTDEIWPMHTEHPEMFELLDIGEYAKLIK